MAFNISQPVVLLNHSKGTSSKLVFSQHNHNSTLDKSNSITELLFYGYRFRITTPAMAPIKMIPKKKLQKNK
jgi:hypothetical protein